MNNSETARSSSNFFKPYILLFCSLFTWVLAVASVASPFAIIEAVQVQFNREPVTYTFNLFQICVEFTAGANQNTICSRDGPFPHCTLLDRLRAATAGFSVCFIFIQGFWVWFLVSEIYSKKKLISDPESSPIRRHAVVLMENNHNDTSVEGENNNNNNPNSQPRTPQRPSLTVTGMCCCRFSFLRNPNRIFIYTHVLTVLCSFLAMCIGFAITDKDEICTNYSIFGDDADNSSNNNALVPNATATHLGAMGPLMLIAFLIQLLVNVIIVFWRNEPRNDLGFDRSSALSPALYPDFDTGGRSSGASSVGATDGQYQTV